MFVLEYPPLETVMLTGMVIPVGTVTCSDGYRLCLVSVASSTAFSGLNSTPCTYKVTNWF